MWTYKILLLRKSLQFFDNELIMPNCRVLVFVTFVVLLQSVSNAAPGLNTTQPTLRLVHVLFRHGNRNPESSTCWDGNQFLDEKYYPEGFGQLTNSGKRTEYHLGLFLRQSYDDFLGAEYNINYLDVRTTDYNRTKMSALLVLAGLWPPANKTLLVRDIPWQPIPYNYYPASEEDVLTAAVAMRNSTFQSELVSVYSSSVISEYLAERYGSVMSVLSEYTGIEDTDYSTASSYFDCMKVQLDLGYPLPAWATEMYYTLRDLSTDVYYLMTNTTLLRQMTAGPLVRKILLDSVNFAAGSLTPTTRKMFIYSAHDINVGTFVLSLDAYDLTQPPPYGATVFVELHERDEVFGLEIYYEDYTSHYPHALTIPGCTFFCPLSDFATLVDGILPT